MLEGKFGKNHPSSKEVIQMTKNGDFIAKFYGQREASRITGINNTCISKACLNKHATAGNYYGTFNN